MNIKLDSIRFVTPVFAVGVCLVAFSSSSLREGGHFDFEPNPGALAKSSFGRTVGMALQGPITKFWDRGVGTIEKRTELVAGSRVDEKLFNWVTELRENKSDVRMPGVLGDEYQDYAMARIEKKLSLAWKMDPRNFGNYSIYQMFLWEGFNNEVIEPQMSSRELSLTTLRVSLSDQESPLSLLTAGQAAYDIVFAARTSKNQTPREISEDIKTYSMLLPEILNDFEGVVVAMQSDGRWDQFSEVKKAEFEHRKEYLEHLNKETQTVMESLSKNEERLEGGLAS